MRPASGGTSLSPVPSMTSNGSFSSGMRSSKLRDHARHLRDRPRRQLAVVDHRVLVVGAHHLGIAADRRRVDREDADARRDRREHAAGEQLEGARASRARPPAPTAPDASRRSWCWSAYSSAISPPMLWPSRNMWSLVLPGCSSRASSISVPRSSTAFCMRSTTPRACRPSGRARDGRARRRRSRRPPAGERRARSDRSARRPRARSPPWLGGVSGTQLCQKIVDAALAVE